MAEDARRPDLLEVDDILRSLGSDAERGLGEADARERLAVHGSNDLRSPSGEGVVRRVTRQLRDPMVLLLVAAAAISGLALGERIDGAAILAIVALNVVIATIQEGRAAGALEALWRLETPTATVVREGRTREVEARDLVLGDVVVLAAGDRVPADVRLIEAGTLEVDESLLTGESMPVRKDARARPAADAPVADRAPMAFMGTLVTRGGGRGVVAGTGMNTELGAIAARLGERRTATPLQRDLERVTLRLGVLTVVVATGVFGLVVFRLGVSVDALQEAFLVGVALAVAAVPEGLLAVTTISLALGVRRMADRGAIVRRLPAVETLGAATVIATDKTGTLTENRMRLESVVLADGESFEPERLPSAVRDAFVEIAVLCNDSTLDPPVGDPMEIALLEAAGVPASEVRLSAPRIDAVPFDSERKRMTTLHARGEDVLLLVKGAPEAVLERCSTALTADGVYRPIEDPDALVEEASRRAEQGLRLLALARRSVSGRPDPEEAERNLGFVAFAGFRDPVRPEAAPSIEESRAAGIEVLMVTGDHAGTASSVAREIGLATGEGRVLTGADLRRNGFPSDPVSIPVYARVDPDQKLELVDALRRGGHVVAVTGDGVNDAPALRRADIGVALGRSGTDVAREAADMVITDDNLATIVHAIREGRGIYANIRKVVGYLVTCNLSEVAVVVIALLAFPALGVPLLPLQLLWMNLVTDGLPALALGIDLPDPGVMRRPPRPPGERMLGALRLARLGGRGLVLAAVTLGALVVSRYGFDADWEHARAVMFTVLVGVQLLYAVVVRTAGRRRASRNLRLAGGVALGAVLQVGIVVWEPAHDIFGTTLFAARDWFLACVAALTGALVLGLLARRRPPERG